MSSRWDEKSQNTQESSPRTMSNHTTTDFNHLHALQFFQAGHYRYSFLLGLQWRQLRGDDYGRRSLVVRHSPSQAHLGTSGNNVKMSGPVILKYRFNYLLTKNTKLWRCCVLSPLSFEDECTTLIFSNFHADHTVSRSWIPYYFIYSSNCYNLPLPKFSSSL